MLGRDLMPVLASQHVVLGLDHAACDITDESAVRGAVQDWRPELIVNCAAYPDVDGCERNPERAFAVNGRAPGILARAAEAIGARLFHISTDQVFDGKKRTPYGEDDSPNPVNVYGQSKLEGERQVLRDGAASRHMVLRSSWLYGIHRSNFVEGVLAQAQSHDQLAYVADQICSPTWTLHLAQKIAELTPLEASGILHVAGSGGCSRQEFARYIIQRLPRPVAVNPTTWAQLNLPAKRPAYSVLGSSGLGKLHLMPLPHWKEAVDEYLQVRQTAMAQSRT